MDANNIQHSANCTFKSLLDEIENRNDDDIDFDNDNIRADANNSGVADDNNVIDHNVASNNNINTSNNASQYNYDEDLNVETGSDAYNRFSEEQLRRRTWRILRGSFHNTTPRK
jgi:hypothetical protein